MLPELKECATESHTTLVINGLCLGKSPVHDVIAVSAAEIRRTCLVWSQHYQPCRSFGGEVIVNLLSDVCSFILSSSEVLRRRHVGFQTSWNESETWWAFILFFKSFIGHLQETKEENDSASKCVQALLLTGSSEKVFVEISLLNVSMYLKHYCAGWGEKCDANFSCFPTKAWKLFMQQWSQFVLFLECERVGVDNRTM